MNFAVYAIFLDNGQMVHEMLHCDITIEFASILVDRLEQKYPDRFFYADELKTEDIQIHLN